MNRRFFLKTLKYSSLSAFFSLGYLSFIHIPNGLVINEYEIEVENWNKELENLKIVFFSDNHTDGRFGTMSKLKRIIDKINSLKPDIVFFGGDIARNKNFKSFDMPAIAKEFKKINATYGTYCVFGNHDWGYNAPKIKELFEWEKLHFFENENLLIKTNYGNIRLVALADAGTRYVNFTQAFRNTIKDEPTIVLSHNPDTFEATNRQFSIMLAGHTHGGQIELPFIGALIVPSIYGRKYARGVFTKDKSSLFVTHGCGSASLFARFPRKPEIALLKLKEKEVC